MSESFDSMTVKYLRELVEKIGGPARVRQLMDGGLVVKKWLPNFYVFASVWLGHEPKSNFLIRKHLREAGFQLVEGADDLLGSDHFKITKTETKVDLVAASPAELGFNESTRTYTSSVFDVARYFGLDPCPLEVGPKLCLLGQPKEALVIASDARHETTFELLPARGEQGPWLNITWIHGRGGFEIPREMRLVWVRSSRLNPKLTLDE